ncbi:MAG: nucleotidyltransferase domain-containing protein [Nanoarchaeota archaeon]
MITKNIKERVKEHFLKNPSSKLRVRQIERELKLPLPSVIRYCKELEKEGILKKTEISETVFYSADRTSKKFILEKRIFNIKEISDSGLIEYLVSEYSNPVIVIFGSYSKGEDTEESDIDIYIETPSKKEIKIDKFEKILRKEIQIFKQSNLVQIENKHLRNSIINGFCLNNSLEVFK